MLNTVILLTVVALVHSHDFKVGNNTDGRKIFDEVRHASPAIWRQTDCITINTTDAEVISRIVITDLRPDKDGDVKITDGGEGQKNVTIELKSPTILRGYDFQIEVYAVPENQGKQNIPTDEGQVRKQRNPEEFTQRKPNLYVPETKFESTTDVNSGSISNDTNVNETKTADSNAENVNNDQVAVDSEAVDDKETKNTADDISQSKGQVPDSNISEHPRHGRDATTETPLKGSNGPSTESITVRPLFDNGFVIHSGIDYSNYSATDLFPNKSSQQDDKRNARDVINTPPVLTNEQTKTVENTKENDSASTKKVNYDQLAEDSRAVAEKETNNTTDDISESKEQVSDSNISDHPRHGRDATTETLQKGSDGPTTESITVRPLFDNGFVIHPGIDYSNYSATDLFPNKGSQQDDKRNARDVINTPLVLTNEQTKTVEDTKQNDSTSTTARAVTEDLAKTQQPRINLPSQQRPLGTVHYPIYRTTTSAPTTEKSQNKRETELKNTKTTQQEEKVDYGNIPRFLEEQNSTIYEQKPVISIQ